MEKRKKKAKINFSILFFFPTIFLATLKVYTKFEDSGSHRGWEICDRNLDWRERNKDKKGIINRRKLFLSYTIQVIPIICTKFQNPRRSSSWEISDTNFPMYYIGVRDGKGKDKINLSILIFFLIIYLASLKLYLKFENSGWHEFRNLSQKIWLERNKNGQIHGMINRRRLILSYTIQQVITQHLYQISKFWAM